MAPPKPIASAGQASVEYVAAVTLAAAALAGAGVAVGAPELPGRVVATVRTGICIVAGDVCRPADARAAGLAPCTVSGTLRGGGASVDLLVFTVGNHGEYSIARRSDGSVAVALSARGGAGLITGIGLTASPIGLRLGADASLDFQLAGARGWEFPNAAAARAFIGGLPRSAVDTRRWPPAWHSMEAGDRAAAEVLAVLGGHTLAGMESSVSDTAGARIRRDGAVTIYVRAALAPASGRGLLANAGRGATTLLAEYTTGRGGPRELAFRRAQPGPGSGEVTETVGRLDLRDPANWAIARPLVEARVPWPPQGARDLEAVLRRIAQVGVIERATYAVNDRSGSLDVEVKAGLELGIDVHRTDVSRRLVRASARTQGSRERERYDCTAAAA